MTPSSEASTLAPVLGMVGLGMMGRRMAAKAVAAGHEVVGCDPDGTARDDAAAAGVSLAADPLEVAERCDVVGVAVRDLPQLRDALLGRRGACAAGSTRVVVVMSTVGPRGLMELVPAVEAAGHALVDAPILSGSIGEAEAGTLVFVQSGPADACAAAEVHLSTFGAVTRVGSTAGQGQAAKLVNQVMQAVAIAGTLEGVAFAEAFGLDMQTLLPLLQAGAATSWAVCNLERVQFIWNRPGDPLDLIYKDLAAVVDEAARGKLHLPVTTSTFVKFMRPELPDGGS